ncbi:MAG: dihydrofolate reductase [Fibrobacteres bacterium]|nr:dihydrofolate reductase [Fibrobacterota bacterium]
MGRIVISEWMSLDGVFDATLMAEWFNPFHSDRRGAWIRAGIDACESMLYGRTTYQMLAPYWSALQNNEMGVAAKLNGVRKYVVSATLEKADWENSIVIKTDALREISRLKAAVAGDMLLTGSATLAKALLEAGLADELRVLIQPIVMGKGRRFFLEGMRSRLELIGTETLDLGVTALTYKAAKP